MPGMFGGKYQGPIGAVLASKDGEVQTLIKKVSGFKNHLERIMLCIDELSGTYRDLCTEVGSFYKNDPRGLANNVTEGYHKVTESMASVVPRKVNEILRTKVLKSCDEWIVKLEAVRATQDAPGLLTTAERVQHYLEKVDKAKDPKSAARNRDKLAAATGEYEAAAAPIMREMDTVLVAQKAEYSKLVVRVMQFQQAYFKQAYTSCEMMPLMDTLRELVEANAFETGEADRLRQAAAAASGGGEALRDSSDEEFDSSDEEVLKSGGLSSKKPDSPAVLAFNKLADDLEEMFWGGRTPRERDLTAMKDAMYELNSKLLACPKSNRKELRARIDALDAKWKSAVDVHMKLGLTDKGSGYTGGIQKPAPAAPRADAGPDVSAVPPEHVEMLRGDPSLAPEFDQMYGDGAAAKLLGIAPRSVAAVEITASEEHVEMLLKDPSLAPKFDNFYGAGAAERTMAAAAGAPAPEPEPAAVAHAIPPEHADMLRADPSLAEEFDRMYGAGSAAEVLAQPMTETRFQAPPDHVAKLRADTSLAARFDSKYGAGAAQYYLGGAVQAPAAPAPGLLDMTVGTLNQGEVRMAQVEDAKQAAVDRYQQKRQGASPRAPENLLGNGSEYEVIGAMGDTSGAMGPLTGGMEAMSPYSSSEMTPMGGMGGTPMGAAPLGSADALGCYSGIPSYQEPVQQQQPVQEPLQQEPVAPATASQPPPEHIEMLLADPGFAEQFDEVYGIGSAQYYLSTAQPAQEPLSSDSSTGSPMMHPAAPYREASFDFAHDQDSDDDIIHSSVPANTMQPQQQPTPVSDFDFFPEPIQPAPQPPQEGPPQIFPEDSQSPRTIRWRQVNQQRVAMGLAPKPHPGAKV